MFGVQSKIGQSLNEALLDSDLGWEVERMKFDHLIILETSTKNQMVDQRMTMTEKHECQVKHHAYGTKCSTEFRRSSELGRVLGSADLLGQIK